MTLATLTWFTIGACLVYVIAQDASVYEWLVLCSRSTGIWVRRQWFLIRHNPDSPWVRWQIDRNARKIAEQLLKEYENK
jgi:hypothetical protein